MAESFDTVDYRDKHGVIWHILSAGTALFATPDSAGARRYDPTPDDVGPVAATPGSPDMARQTLQGLIEEEVKGLMPALVVQAGTTPWWVWVGLLYLLTRR